MDMDGLKTDDFPAFFKAVWGFDPFPWQADLLHRLATGQDPRRSYAGEPGLWPDVLDLPTGAGKTAALDIAVFHLALEAAKGGERRAPVRIAFVVDRRLIVDDAASRGEQIHRALTWSLCDEKAARSLIARPDLAEAVRRVRAASVVKAVAAQLQSLAGAGQPLLVVRRLRGGAPREDDWARTPIQPTILCSTVDQVGSRLLFRGYGVSDVMKPLHAGLLGSDCLILLDEAHLSEPFRQTLKAITRLRAPDDAPFGFALLTATPGGKADRPFSLSSADEAHPILSRRIKAAKPARLAEIAGKQGLDTESRRTEEVSREVEAAIDVLRKRGIAQPAVGVVLNRVARARAVFERLANNLKLDIELKLLIGPARSVERDKHAKELEPIRTRQSDTPRELAKPLVVVATQTIEVGVDIDFDGLVTEAAALDALRQRFGRLNRGGREIAPAAVVLAHLEDVGAKADDPVYGNRIATTWTVLQRLSAKADGVVDFGFEALRRSMSESEAADLAAPTNDAPVLLPAYTDLWSQTSPIPNADPEVALFLHGPDRSPASIQIVWRADIERRDLRAADEARLTELLSLMSPRAAEAIEVPLWAARSFLEEESGPLADLSDIAEREPVEARRGRSRPAFRFAGEDSERTGVVYARQLRNGDLIVVPAGYGGCDEWGWKPRSSQPVIDVADLSLWPYRERRFAVRVTPELIAQGRRLQSLEREQREAVDGEQTIDLDEIGNALKIKLAEHGSDRTVELLNAVGEIALPKQMLDRLNALLKHKGRIEHEFAYGFDDEERPCGVVFIAPGGLKTVGAEESVAVPATEDEGLGAVSEKAVSLIEHVKCVRSWAESFAIGAGFSQKVIADIALSAFLHDAGKADPRYQAYYAGGDPYGPDTEKVLAKSGQRRLPRGAWQRAGLPPHWRHEALSVRLAMIHPHFEQANDSKLVLWLIGSHHGRGRPMFPHADAKDADRRAGLLKAYGLDGVLKPGPGPQSLAFDFDGHDWPQMFEALKAKYGIWGLARLEAFVRLADHRASEDGARPEFAGPYKEAAE